MRALQMNVHRGRLVSSKIRITAEPRGFERSWRRATGRRFSEDKHQDLGSCCCLDLESMPLVSPQLCYGKQAYLEDERQRY